MIPAPVPADEERRLAVLRALDILDTPAEERFDRITRLAAAIFEVPIAIVGLIDANRQWFKSCVGLDGHETERSVTFCGHAIDRADALVIEDALLDPRFADNPFVTGEPHIRFYAGHPLRIEGSTGSAIGTLCVVDREPRPFTGRDRRLLADLAALVEEQLTGRQLAQMTQQLADSEAFLTGILDSVAEAVATFSPDGTVLSLNHAGEVMFGRSADDIVGQPVTTLVAEDDVPTVGRLLRQRAGHSMGERVAIEVGGCRADDTAFRMEVSASELSGSDGQVFIAVARDVSELASLRQQQQAILDAAGDGIIGVGLDGRVTFANPAALELLGRDGNDIVGALLHAETHHTRADGTPYPWDECPTYRTIVEAAPHRVDGEVYWRSDGTSFTAAYASSPIVDGGGAVTGAVIVFSDISERHEMETIKDQFVSVVSHELRTPLTSIKGSLGLVAGGVLGELPEEPKQMIEVALSNTDRLVRLVNDILDLERISSGKLELHLSACDAGEIADAAAKAVAGSAELADVRIELDPRSVVLRCDEDRLVQAVTNLIGNAVKFSPPGGLVRVTVLEDGEDVWFVVTDQGRGIPADQLDSVFERFQQVDLSDRREKGGTGLGLAITRSIALQHGGEVTVESELGVGSTFTLRIPIEHGD